MKLIRFGEPGAEKPGFEQEDGTRRDVSGEISDYTPRFFADGGLDKLRELAAHPDDCPQVPAGTRLGPPVARPHKFLAIGLNYKQHAKEVGSEIPSEPVVFTKATSCICGPDDPTLLPRGSEKLDYEVELAFVIKDTVRNLASEADALAHIAGFTICNDVSERHHQLEQGGQWVKGKSADSFGPLGPFLITPDDLPDFANLEVSTKVNGAFRQKSNTNDMIFSVPHCLWYLSQYLTLEPGDVVTTGTPEGVAVGMNDPAAFLKSGDKVEVSIAKLGTQTQLIRRD
ncbi:MAG: fumarylacetoacetate hydrolase family protein [SAR324 cluster bacterium]|nr:fumarylacetoacetate hydrolase family protein [SAR324 cluster bacterium]MCZ6646222.1 fumarylacetoacetate hydrolase family protein [SAR324 cluster bacterium]